MRRRRVNFGLLSAPKRGRRITDRTRITDCRRIRSSPGLPDYGFFQDPGRFVVGQARAKKEQQCTLPRRA
eukprot:15483689-Alexandrium_andersonii.AAC.1